MNFTVVKKNLEAKGFLVSCFNTAEEAAMYLDAEIDRKTVGFGGSVTLEQLGLYEKLSSHNTVSWHQRIPSGKTDPQVRAEENAAQIYVSSVNALAETGEIINIDGLCNRVAAVFYGHEKVYLVAGQNKLAPDYDSALYRARNIAGPLNAKRLNKNTPCAAKGEKCYDCKSPERICCGLSVLWSKPLSCPYEVILIRQDLGL